MSVRRHGRRVDIGPTEIRSFVIGAHDLLNATSATRDLLAHSTRK